MHLLARFARNESGATAIEYCLIASGIASVIIVAVNGVGSALNNKFTSINSQLR
jgi:pilus assembly protein Flp/PilA